MGPLDMRGLVGAATIMGCLKYGACFSGLDEQDDPVRSFFVKETVPYLRTQRPPFYSQKFYLKL